MTLRKNSIFYSAGIIAVDQAKILSGPGDSFKISATINRSKIIKIIENSDSDYIEVGILDEGIKGWKIGLPVEFLSEGLEEDVERFGLSNK